MTVLDSNFKSQLTEYVSSFIARVTSDSTSQILIKTTPQFDTSCKTLGIRFKTSFGHGSLADIPWMACFVPGQSAQLEGVYPVLLFQRSTGKASVSYGVSASAMPAVGIWPRTWPERLTEGLPQFAIKKKEYKKSSVFKEFQGQLSTQSHEITDSLMKVIEDFLALQTEDTLLNQTTFDASAFNELLDALNDSALHFDISFTRRLVTALLVKPFCLLTGLAGSGKTKLAEAFAMWLCESEAQFQLVAVGADWTSNENLLGYADALIPGTYVVPGNGVLQLLLRAIADPSKPYFLILDEMNLSHVERYFADFLSAIESTQGKLALHGQGTLKAGAVDIPEWLVFPRNLFIIGTVNVDETTYMFSPKVLDRANVIEFRASKEQMAAFLDEPTGIDLKQLRAQGVNFAAAFVSRAQLNADMGAVKDTEGIQLRPKLKDDLLEIFATLEAIGGEFGFRTAKEIARFVVIHQELSGDGWQYKDALDAQVLQKLMPKLHGSARKLSGVLDGLHVFANKHTLPLTLEKVQRMQARLKRDGFTSFAEN